MSRMTQPAKRIRPRVAISDSLVHQADSDGYIEAYRQHTGAIALMTIKVDSFTPPANIVSQYRNDDGNSAGSICFFVPKGHYYQVENQLSAFWIPFK